MIDADASVLLKVAGTVLAVASTAPQLSVGINIAFQVVGSVTSLVGDLVPEEDKKEPTTKERSLGGDTVDEILKNMLDMLLDWHKDFDFEEVQVRAILDKNLEVVSGAKRDLVVLPRPVLADLRDASADKIKNDFYWFSRGDA